MILAVLQQRAGATIGGQDAYVATVGGVKVTEPAADLAIALAVASAVRDEPFPSDGIAFGEIGLAGEIRSVSGMPRRLAEAARLGFKRAWVPRGWRAADRCRTAYGSSRSGRCGRRWAGPSARRPGDGRETAATRPQDDRETTAGQPVARTSPPARQSSTRWPSPPDRTTEPDAPTAD